MSQEDVQVVQRFLSPYEGEDLVAPMQEFVERFGPDFPPDAVLAFWAEDPSWQHAHPDIEWDSRAAGLLLARGPRELSLWVVEWLEAWDRYVNRVVEYRDLGDWVLVLMDIRARGRQGIAVETLNFSLYQVRDGKVAVYRTFRSEREALEAARVRE
jgi:LmbE family N-acetylglucosaminyl deacetylase